MNNCDSRDSSPHIPIISPQTDDVANAVEKIAKNLEQIAMHQNTGTHDWSDMRRFLLPQEDDIENSLKRVADALEQMSKSE